MTTLREIAGGPIVVSNSHERKVRRFGASDWVPYLRLILIETLTLDGGVLQREGHFV